MHYTIPKRIKDYFRSFVTKILLKLDYFILLHRWKPTEANCPRGETASGEWSHPLSF